MDLRYDKHELLWKILEREVGANIPKYLKILLEHEAFNAFALLAAMPNDIKEKLENTAKQDFGEFDEMHQMELLKKCKNNEIMTFKLREGDVVLLSLMKTSILRKSVNNMNELLHAEKKKRKRHMLKDSPAEEKNPGEFSIPKKKPNVPFDQHGINADLEEYGQKIVRMANGWIVNSFTCIKKEIFFIKEEDIKFVVTSTAISTSIRCRVCHHDVKIVTDSSEGRPVKFIISNFSRHCKSHEMRQILRPRLKNPESAEMDTVNYYQIQEELNIKEESIDGGDSE